MKSSLLMLLVLSVLFCCRCFSFDVAVGWGALPGVALFPPYRWKRDGKAKKRWGWMFYMPQFCKTSKPIHPKTLWFTQIYRIKERCFQNWCLVQRKAGNVVFDDEEMIKLSSNGAVSLLPTVVKRKNQQFLLGSNFIVRTGTSKWRSWWLPLQPQAFKTYIKHANLWVIPHFRCVT